MTGGFNSANMCKRLGMGNNVNITVTVTRRFPEPMLGEGREEGKGQPRVCSEVLCPVFCPTLAFLPWARKVGGQGKSGL